MIDGGRPQAAPSSFGGKATKPIPSVAVAPYDPRTGRYVAPTGSRTSNRICNRDYAQEVAGPVSDL